MNCTQAKNAFPDHLAGTLQEAVRAELEAHLEQCAACREEQEGLLGLWTKLSALPEREPSPAADTRFRSMLDAYRAGLDQSGAEKAHRFRLADWLMGWGLRQVVWRFGVILLLVGGGVLAGWTLRRDQGKPTSANGAAVTELRQEVRTLKEQMALALLQQKSASERLRGVEWTSRLGSPDEKILDALLRALDADPNVNVRLAVVEALQPFAREAVVKKALLQALARQQSPLVQVELIDLLVEVDNKESIPVLKSVSENREMDEFVRERARWGLAQL